MATDSRPPHVDSEAVRDWLAGGNPPRLIDVRTPAEFETAHIPGSYNVPLHLVQEHRDELLHHLDGTDVVLVCRSGQRAGQAGRSLAGTDPPGTGLRGVHILDGGIAAWQFAGAPVTRGRARWDLERQVRLVAGALVALAVLGSLLVPGLYWLAGLVGAGLVVAAVTNTCVMGMLLARLPYNRGAACDLDSVVRRLATPADRP